MSEQCKNCGYKLITKATKKSASQLRKPYYYTAYYYCIRCKKLYHDEKFKIVNNALFEQTQPEPIFFDKTTSYDAEIWTDGACIYNGTPQAKAAWAFVSEETERAGLVDGKQTNNVAEGLAIYHALKWAAESGHKTIKLSTDSQISLFNLKKPVNKILHNREIFEDIQAIITTNKLQVTFEKVLGHSGDPNNERADKLANGLATKH